MKAILRALALAKYWNGADLLDYLCRQSGLTDPDHLALYALGVEQALHNLADVKYYVIRDQDQYSLTDNGYLALGAENP